MLAALGALALAILAPRPWSAASANSHVAAGEIVLAALPGDDAAAGASPLAELLATAFFAAKDEVAPVYRDRDYRPVWLAGEGERARTLIATLSQADAHALPVARYRVAELAERLNALE